MPASPPQASPPHDTADAPAQRPAPANLRDLFWSFTWLALQGFGGVLAVVQRELVEKKRWLTNDEFVEDWAVAQIMPGPNVVNLSITIGERYFGWRGAVVAVCGMLCFPMLLVLTLTVIYSQLAGHPAMAGALRGMGAVAAGLVAGMGLKLTSTLSRHPLGRWCSAALALASFIAMAVLRAPLAWVLQALAAWPWASVQMAAAPLLPGVAAVAGGVLLYTLWSGFRASVLTDFMQVIA